MIRRIAGLDQTELTGNNHISDGVFLVRVERAHYQQAGRKPFLLIQFSVVQPAHCCERHFSARLSCTTKALWKLKWFLRDFNYDQELLALGQVDEKLLVGMRGVVKISRAMLHGQAFLNLDAFAPAEVWDQFPISSRPSSMEVA